MYIKIQIFRFYLDYKLWYWHVCIHVDLVGQFVQWPPMESVKIFFSWKNVFKNTFSSISTPENVYLDKKKSIWGGLEAEILIRTQIWSAIL